MNFWDKLMGSAEEASMYMSSYGEGPDAGTRTMLVSLINDGESILDVGCGPGWNYERFKKDLPSSRYRGTDYSKFMIDGCLFKYPEADFVVEDARNLSLESKDSWDVVILQDVLEHTNGWEKPIQEALRVARKRIIVTFWHLTQDQDQINDDGDDGWGAWYSQPKWEKYLDSLDLHWLHDQIDVNKRQRDFYIIDKETKHG